jgi:glycosyltransferase involved in cell wall biosynthesis
MLDKNTIDILRKKFSESYFFVRIFNHNGATYIWNDKTIYIKLVDNTIKNIDLFVETTIKLFKKSIEKKYEKMSGRLLSVVIPNYNNELTIKNTIDSILNSTYKDIEIIIIDDCSTDKSVEIIKNLYGMNPLVKLYINNKNEGTFYGRNKGILMSNGYYIANVDGDDTIHPDKFSFEIGELEKENKNEFKYWGYGTNFTRLFYEGHPDNIVKRTEITNKVLFTCYRRLFNYMGYYHNSRYGADPDYFITRAAFYNYKFYANNRKNYYYALSTAGKNLTRTVSYGFVLRYYREMSNKYRDHLYVDMALLDDTPEFIRLFIHR